MIAAVIALAVAVSGTLGLLAYAIVRAFAAKDGEIRAIRDAVTIERGLRATQADLQAMGGKATVLASALEAEKGNAQALVRRAAMADNHRNALLAQLAELGDPDGVAASIRAELAELQKLSEVPGRGGAASPAAGEGRRPGPVPD